MIATLCSKRRRAGRDSTTTGNARLAESGSSIMSNHQEPFDDSPQRGGSPEALESQIGRLVQRQPFAVLCTQGGGQPYGSLVAFAVTEDLSQAVFATPRATRKFRLLSECDHVALVIDSRPDFPDRLMEIEAVTATGRAVLVEQEDDFDRWASLLTGRHPYLFRFVQSASCGLFRIQIVRYFHVSRFQEVRQWVP